MWPSRFDHVVADSSCNKTSKRRIPTCSGNKNKIQQTVVLVLDESSKVCLIFVQSMMSEAC